jgi:hypothetical protein
MKRRDFLKASAAAGVGAFLSKPENTPVRSDEFKKYMQEEGHPRLRESQVFDDVVSVGPIDISDEVGHHPQIEEDPVWSGCFSARVIFSCSQCCVHVVNLEKITKIYKIKDFDMKFRFGGVVTRMQVFGGVAHSMVWKSESGDDLLQKIEPNSVQFLIRPHELTKLDINLDV